MARGSLPEEVMKEAARRALELALANARSEDALEAIYRGVVAAGVGNAAAPRRRSPRVHASPELKEDEPEQEEPDDEELFPPVPIGPRQARVRKLREFLHPDTKVGHKRKRRAFNEVRWEEIEAAYKVNHKMLVFKPTSAPLPEEHQEAFRKHLKVLVATSPEDINRWTEDNVKEMAKVVFRYAGYAFDNVTLEVDSEVDVKNKELGVNGRADIVVKKEDQDIVIVECKRGSVNYSKGVAQMVLAAETLLAKKLKDSPNSCMYGLLTGSMGWTWMYLDSKEGRFNVTSIDAENVKESAEKMATIAYGILLGKPIVKTSKDADSTSGKRIKRL